MKPIYSVVAAAATLLGAVTIGNQNSGSPLAIQTASAQRVAPVTLEEMVADSEKIFSGTCIKIEEFKKDPKAQVPSVEFTFKITEGLKGVMGGETKFKQYNRKELIIPSYMVGEKYILFLSPPSERSGLTAPIGLQQGCVDVYKKNGEKGEFVNYKGNEIKYEHFVNTIKDTLVINEALKQDLLDKQKKNNKK